MKARAMSRRCSPSARKGGCSPHSRSGMVMDENSRWWRHGCLKMRGGDRLGAVCPFSSHLSQLFMPIYSHSDSASFSFQPPILLPPFLLGQERAKRRRHQLCNPIWSRAQPLLLISTFKTVREGPGVLPHRALDWNSRGLVLVQVLLMTSMLTWDKRCNPSGP